MSSKEFIHQVAKDMGKKPEDFQKYIDILDDNLLDSVEQLRELKEEDWRNDLKFPLGLIKAIMKNLSSGSIS